MKRLIYIITTLLIFTSCVPLKKTNQEYDKTVDFSKYKTFSFYSWDNKNNELINKNDQQMIAYSVENELEDRGIKLTNFTSDLIVDIYVTLVDKVGRAAYTNYYHTGYWNSFYFGPFGYSSFNYWPKEFTEATIIINIFDMKEKKLIWHSSGTGKINDDESEREKGIPDAISHMFFRFPRKKVKK